MDDKNFSYVLVDLFNRFCFTMYITLIKSSLYILYIFACYLYIVVVCFIYSRTLALGATVICWLYPTQNKFYLILSYLTRTNGPVTRKMFPFDDVIMWNNGFQEHASFRCRGMEENAIIVRPIIQGAPNPKTQKYFVSSYLCLCPIHWSHVLSRE